MQVATVMKASGSPRALNWPIRLSDRISDAALTAWIPSAWRLGNSLTTAQLEILSEGEATVEMLERILALAPAGQEALFGTIAQLSRLSSSATMVAFHIAWALHLAKSLIWADAYSVVFDGNGGSTDDLLVNVVAALQDLTR